MRKVIRRQIRRRADGVDLAADVNAVIAVNRGDGKSESVQSTSIVQDARARAGPDDAEAPPPRRPDESKQEEQ